MNRSIEMLRAGWRLNSNKADAMIAAIPQADMVAQPHGRPNHPAWTMAHLVHYHWAILNIARGEPVSDPGLHAGAARDDAGSMPTGDAKQYPSKAARRDAYLAGHEQFDATLAARSDDQLARPVGLSRWAEAFGDSGQALQYLMVFHESTHIGEIMAWRRARGLPAADD